MKKFRSLKQQTHICIIFIITIALFYGIAFCAASPSEVIKGFIKIVFARDVLITDYFVVGGIAGAFFNSAVVMTLSFIILLIIKMQFTGFTIASVIIMGSFAFFGKQPFNILPIIFGTIIYAKTHGFKAERYIHIGFLASAAAPIVTEMNYIMPFSPWVNALIGVILGIMVGYIIVPLSAHTVSMHMGYNIFNVGFAIGIIALIIMTVLGILGFKSESVMIWQSGIPTWLAAVLVIYFVFIMLYGLILSDFKLKPALKIMEHPGRLVADFVLMDGLAPTLINMSLMGLMALSYILIIGGDLSGPVLGAILTVFGFGAFGMHPKNSIPVILGVFLASTVGIYSPQTPSFQIAAIFSCGLAPIAGQFGIIAGIAAGFLHSAVVANTGVLYSGMNLYNNGFAAGFVAIFMIPIIESFMKHYKRRHESDGTQQ